MGLGLVVLFVFKNSSPAIIAEYAPIARSFVFLGEPVALTTVFGYVTFRAFGLLVPVLLCIWTVLAGARLLRFEEERGELDVLLSTPQARARIVMEKVLAFALALLSIGIVIGLGTALGEAGYGVQAEPGRALLAGFNVALLALFFGALAFLFSQIVLSRGAAAGYAGALIAVFFVIDGVGRVSDAGSWLQYLSPFYYYNLNKPLIETYSGNIGGALFLFLLDCILIAIGLFLFVKRDIGSVALKTRTAEARSGAVKNPGVALARAERDIFERSVGLRTIKSQALASVSWMVGVGVLVFMVTLMTPVFEKPMQKLMSTSPSVFTDLFVEFGSSTDAAFLAGLLLTFLPVVLAVFSLFFALAWAGDLERGRLELLLSTPVSRTRLVLERFSALVVGIVIMGVVAWLAIILGIACEHLQVNIGRTFVSVLAIMPLELLVGALVFLLAMRLRYSLVLGIACVFIVVSFLFELLEKEISSDFLLNLSVFHLYGHPIVEDVPLSNYIGTLVVGVLMLLLSIAVFRYKNIERGA